MQRGISRAISIKDARETTPIINDNMNISEILRGKLK